MGAERDPVAFNARIEALIDVLESSSDGATRDRAKELLRLVLEFHATGLARMIDILAEEPRRTARLTTDPVIAALLALHDLVPPEPPRLIQISRGPSAPSPDATDALVARGHGGSCERCGAPLDDRHRHVVDINTRELSCRCRACWLLLASDESARSQRAVPDRCVQGPALSLSRVQWDALQIPVEMAFFLSNSAIGRTIAFYPSPAGATESALPLAAWRDVVDANPWVRSALPDVEAVLVRKERDDDRYQCFILPIDACYELVGRIRLHWTGFAGGEGVRMAVDAFFAGVAARTSAAGTDGASSR
jgi:hypothetical protein